MIIDFASLTFIFLFVTYLCINFSFNNMILGFN